jgi:hypothetical protein
VLGVAIALLVTSFVGPAGSAYAISSGTTSVGSPYVPDRIWDTWNATEAPLWINAAGIALTKRTVYLESRNGNSSSQCVDAMWDWTVSGGHYDGRVLRNCRKGKLYVWNQPEPPSPANDNYSFVEEHRFGLCYLFGVSNSGAAGTNAPSNSARSNGCFGGTPQAGLLSMQANVVYHNFCIGMMIYYNSNTPIPYANSNPRDCNG